jgi:D-alanyl-D-alanine dipeptidase
MLKLAYLSVFLGFALLLQSCGTDSNAQTSSPKNKLDNLPNQMQADSIYTKNTDSQAVAVATKSEKTTFINVDSLLRQNDSAWVDMELVAPDMVFDIRYATTNNFVGEVMYDCPKCFLRVATARAALKVHTELKTTHNYRLKMYDCYRPWSVQNKLWKKVPDKRYVAPPDKGSQHNRGLAIDLTIVDAKGEELDMGTTFDFFGKEAYWSYTGHSAKINKNRQILRTTMEKHGFGTSSTEWWHYSYRKKSFTVSNYQWVCD